MLLTTLPYNQANQLILGVDYQNTNSAANKRCYERIQNERKSTR